MVGHTGPETIKTYQVAADEGVESGKVQEKDRLVLEADSDRIEMGR
jgi:hypothetical protein